VFSGAFYSKSHNKVMYVTGDVRTMNANAQWPVLSFNDLRPAKPNMARLYVAGGSMTITNQSLNLSRKDACFRVAEGASLIFLNGPNAKYQWTQAPSRIVVDGTMDVRAPFVGGCDQVYGGSGTLKLASLSPSTASSCVMLTDSLTVESPGEWPTVDSDGADTPLILEARSGRPVVHAESGWAYGPASGTTTTTAAADRAAYVHDGATLAVEPGGGIATFVDPVDGAGTLEITNGTLKVTGGISSETSLAVAANGTFAWDEATAVAGLTAAAGGTLAYYGEPLTVSGDVSLAGVVIQDADGVAEASGWHRVLVAKSFDGDPVIPSIWETRIVELDGGMVAFEVHAERGTLIIVR